MLSKQGCVTLLDMGRTNRARDTSRVTVQGLVVDRMRRLKAEQERLAVELTEVVAQGRAAGMTWEDFGQAFGITRQAARQRWGRGEVAARQEWADATAAEAVRWRAERLDSYDEAEDGELIEYVDDEEDDWAAAAVEAAQAAAAEAKR